MTGFARMQPRPLLAALVLISTVAAGCGPTPTPAEYLERARAHESAGKYRAAAIETRNALQSDGENVDARLLLGLLQLRLGDAVGAEKELTRARALGADVAAVRPALARSLRLQGKFDELRALDGAGLPAEDESAILANRAYGHLAAGEAALARADAERALELDPASADATLVLAWIDAAAGDLAAAESRLRARLDAAPGDAGAWELLGDVEQAAGRPAQALAAYDEAIELSNRTLGARLKRAQVRLARGDDEAALTDLDALSKAGVEMPDIDLARGQIDLRAGDLGEAQLRFENALKTEPDYPPALGNLALTHLALGNLEQAEQYGKQMMSATGDSDAARRLLAAVRLESGRHELAADTLEPMLQNGNDPFAARLMNAALLKQDKHEQAIEGMLLVAAGLLPEDGESVVAPESPLVLARAPRRELLEEITGGDAAAMEREPVENFLDEDDRRIARVLELLARGRNEEALKEAEVLRAALPDSAVPHNLIGRVHLAGRREPAARAAFERALESDARDVTALQALARLDLRAGDADAARARLEKALSGSGDSESVLLFLARLEAQAGDEAAMLEWLEQARAEHADSAAPIMLLARYRASRAEHERALEELGELDERQRAQPVALQLEGASLLALRRFDAALERFDALVDRQSDQPQWHYLRAQAHAGLSDNEATLHDLERALELAPEHVPSLLAMTNLEILRGDFDAAEARVDELRDLIPGRAELDAVAARLAERREAGPAQGVPDELRIESSKEALTAARDLYAKGEPDKATGLLETWLGANPQDIAVRLTLANTYAGLERIDQAIGEYETLLEGGEEALPEQARLAALNNLAWYLRDRDAARAVDYAERALAVTPDSVATLDTLAMIHFGQGDFDAAKAAYRRASAIGIDDPSVRFHGARIEAALGNDAAARAILEPLVDGGIEFPEAEEAAELLEDVARSGN